MKGVLALAALVALVGCSAESKDEAKSYTYSYTFNGCATGEHTFSSLSDMCAALQNETLNKNCAQGMRQDRFQADCPGTFTPF